MHSEMPIIHTYVHIVSSFVHPGRDATGAKPSGESQASRSHREVADEIPHQGDDLNDGRDQCQNRTLELRETLVSRGCG